MKLDQPLPDPVTSERIYTEEEAAWLRALESYKTKYRRRFLTASEHLYVLKDMGYRRGRLPDADLKVDSAKADRFFLTSIASLRQGGG